MLVTIARYDFPHEAHIARSLLDSEGIPCFVADEHTVNMNWLYTFAMGGVRVQVPAQFAEQANLILAEDRSGDLPAEEPEKAHGCPKCGAGEMGYYLKGKRLAYLMFIFLQFPLWRVQPAYRCGACGYEQNET